MSEKQKVWDPVVRIFHWTLAASVMANFFLLEAGELPHRYTGYLACSLVLGRIVWGFIGSKHARFADFFPTPRKVREHLADLRAGRPDPHLGHNPLGGVMMLSLLAMVLGMGITGWMMGTDQFYEVDWVKQLHEGLANFMMACVAMHVAAALVMSRLTRINLVRAMITGNKEHKEEREDQPEAVNLEKADAYPGIRRR
jgi:cytochrome b